MPILGHPRYDTENGQGSESECACWRYSGSVSLWTEDTWRSKTTPAGDAVRNLEARQTASTTEHILSNLTAFWIVETRSKS